MESDLEERIYQSFFSWFQTTIYLSLAYKTIMNKDCC